MARTSSEHEANFDPDRDRALIGIQNRRPSVSSQAQSSETPPGTRRKNQAKNGAATAGSDLKILMVSAEFYPLAKTGGLADACTALASSLNRPGVELRLLMPAYRTVLENLQAEQCASFDMDLGGLPLPARLLSGTLPDSPVKLWLLDCPSLYRRPGGLYQDEMGADWPDNFRRYAALCVAAARIATGRIPRLGWRPDLVHCHDWCTGLVPLLLAHCGPPRPATVFTIHNASFQGNFPMSAAAELGVPADALGPDGAEFYGRFSFLKAGVRYADAVTTVSRRYAREICTPEFGCGLEGLFAARRENLIGIRNGVDTALWNPAADPWLAQNYSVASPAGKARCKRALQRRLGLRPDRKAPLGISVNRLTQQKMADVLLEALPALLNTHPQMQFALLGRGERELQSGFVALAGRYPGRVAVHIGYNEPLAHRLHAGGDFLFHGCRFEPCGMTQQYAMRYGTLPIVRRTGGLADTVRDADGECGAPGLQTGFIFDPPTGEALVAATEECLSLYATRRLAWKQIQRNAMEEDLGWEASAQEYLGLYAQYAKKEITAAFDSATQSGGQLLRRRSDAASVAVSQAAPISPAAAFQ